MISEIEIKCPYCQAWNLISIHEYANHDILDCGECYSIFRVNDSIIKYV